MSGANHSGAGGEERHAYFPFLCAAGPSLRWRPRDTQIPLLKSVAEDSSVEFPRSPSVFGRGLSQPGS